MSGVLSNRLGVPLFLTRVFHEYVALQSCTCLPGATGMGSPAAGLAAGLEGLAQGLAALDAGLAAGFAAGSSPCGMQFASGTSRVKYDFPLAKMFAKPHIQRAPFARRALTGKRGEGGFQPLMSGRSPLGGLKQWK